MKGITIWLFAFFVLACSLNYKTQTKSHEATPANVKSANTTLQIYSGKENPTWNLTGQQADELISLLENLPKSESLDFSGGLGYTGFHVAIKGENDTKTNRQITAYKGQILYQSETSKEYFTDRERRVEMFLLKTGESSLDAKIMNRVEQEIKLSPANYPTNLPRRNDE